MGNYEPSGRYPDESGVSTATGEEVARSAGVVGAATLASRVLGLVRDVVLASLFAVASTDAFFVAFMIPNLFRRLVGEGSLTISFVPVFTGSLREGREEARRVFNATWTLAAIAGLVIAVLGVLFSDQLISLFAPGFALEPGKHDLAVQLLQLCFPYIAMLTLVAIAMGALNALGHFFTPAISPVLLNVCLVAGAALGVAWFDTPILVLGYAVIVAGVLQVAVQIPALARRGLTPKPVMAPGHPAIRRLGGLMLPAALGASVYQLNLLVSRFLASFQGDGAVSYLYYANRLIEFPLGVFIFALGMVGLTRFAHLAKSADRALLRQTFCSTLGMALALALPSAIGLILLRELLISQLFAWNPSVFGAEAVRSCTPVLALAALGLVPIAVSRIYVNLCVAHENTKTGARAALLSLVVNFFASLALIGPLPLASLPEPWIGWQHAIVVADLGYSGLALAASIAALVNMFYVIVATRSRYGALVDARQVFDWLRLVVASSFMALAIWMLTQRIPVDTQTASLSGVLFLFTSVAFGAGIYLLSLFVLRAPELRALLAIVRRRTSST
ncbi:MAG: murein biosynthesis integral membrane protein MurJ [bacterium]|nr:murein biosynthesis integral membrane protein MurJ [bacterium]